MRRQVRIVILGDSYLLVQISRAGAAHSSPRKNCLAGELSLGLAENRAAAAQTDNIRTGGSVLFLSLLVCFSFFITYEV